MKRKRYCNLCGNEQTTAEDGVGTACRRLLEGPLRVPGAFYAAAEDRYSKCCGGISTGRDHLYFHSEGWECSYGAAPNSVSVEMGVSFYKDHAQTYYICDTGNDSSGIEYGDPIYYARLTGAAFWAQLESQLAAAAAAAWNNDLLTCEVCEKHYYGPNGPCCEETE